MKTYVITRTQGAPDWTRVPGVDIDTCLWTEPAQVAARAQVCYDEEALYVRLSTQEAHIRAEERGEAGMPCLDSCLEFFFCPDPAKNIYFNIEFNPNGCMYLGFGSDRYDLVRLIPEAPVFTPEILRTEDGWEILPAESLNFSLQNNLLRAEISANGQTTALNINLRSKEAAR